MHGTGHMNAPIRAIGLMSGTSMDGIDVAMIETDGERVTARGLGTSRPYGVDERSLIAEAVAQAKKLEQREGRPEALARAEEMITRAHSQVVRDFLAANGIPESDIAIVGFHGQTVLHRPEAGLTVQLGDGSMLAEMLRRDVVFDFRGDDVAAHGEGAPFVPAYHRALVETAGIELPVAVLNIGGISNVTWVGNAGDLFAFDIGPGNALIDDWAMARTGQAMDVDGALARQGGVDEAVLERLFDDPFFTKKPPKSLDRGDFSIDAVAGLDAADGAATLTAFTAEAIARAAGFLAERPANWVVTGGGARNPVLMGELRTRLAGRVEPAEAFGWSSEFMEAEAFAFLAVRSLYGLPLTFPETTGVRAPQTGGRLVRPPQASS